MCSVNLPEYTAVLPKCYTSHSFNHSLYGHISYHTFLFNLLLPAQWASRSLHHRWKMLTTSSNLRLPTLCLMPLLVLTQTNSEYLRPLPPLAVVVSQSIPTSADVSETDLLTCLKSGNRRHNTNNHSSYIWWINYSRNLPPDPFRSTNNINIMPGTYEQRYRRWHRDSRVLRRRPKYIWDL